MHSIFQVTKELFPAAFLFIIRYHLKTLYLFGILCFSFLFGYIMWKRNPYKSAKNHYFVYISVVTMVIVIYLWVGLGHFAQKDAWISIADNILSGAIFGIFCVLSYWFERYVKNRYEDSEKLTEEYEDLSQLYRNNDLVQVEGGVTYPIILLGIGVIPLTKGSNSNVKIQDSISSIYQLPSLVESYFMDIFSIHDTSVIYNNLNIRVRDMYLRNNKLYLETERTHYYNSLVTNRAADFEISEGFSVRQLYEPGPEMTALKYSKLSNHLGFNGFIESSDEYIVFIFRTNEVSIGKNTYGDSLGASLKTKYALNKQGEFDYKGLRYAIMREIKDELKICEKHIEEDSLTIFAAYRDCVECGKPQFLVYAKSKLTAKEITKKFISKVKLKKDEWKKEKKEITKKERLEMKVLEDGTNMVWLSKKDLIEGIDFEYNGIRMNDSASNGFFFFKNEKMICKKIDFLNMVPSASAAVYLFREFLNNGDIS